MALAVQQTRHLALCNSHNLGKLLLVKLALLHNLFKYVFKFHTVNVYTKNTNVKHICIHKAYINSMIGLGKRLRQARMDKGILMVHVAEKLGVTQPTVSRWESDEFEPDLTTLVKLTELYETTLNFLAGIDPY